MEQPEPLSVVGHPSVVPLQRHVQTIGGVFDSGIVVVFPVPEVVLKLLAVVMANHTGGISSYQETTGFGNPHDVFW